MWKIKKKKRGADTTISAEFKIIDCRKFDKSRPAIHPFSLPSPLSLCSAGRWLKVPKRIYKSVFRMKSDVSETLHFMIYWKYREYLPSSFSLSLPPSLTLHVSVLPHSIHSPYVRTTCAYAAVAVVASQSECTDSKVYRRRRTEECERGRERERDVTPAILRRTTTTDWRNIRKSFLQ